MSNTKNIRERPAAYKTGAIEFCGLLIKVTPDVLIPRFETEQLIKEIINFARKNLPADKPLKILDVGTGSGCISIALAKEISSAQITALDISEKALRIAKENAKIHQVEKQITFIKSDLLSNLSEEKSQPDIIVANLPYIPTLRIPTLDSSVKDFEPLIALDGGSDGFDLYQKLFKQIAENGITPKLIIVEIDDTHRGVALKEAQRYFPQAKTEIKKDTPGLDRLLKIQIRSPDRSGFNRLHFVTTSLSSFFKRFFSIFQ